MRYFLWFNIFVSAVLLLLLFLLFASSFFPWVRCYVSGAPLTVIDIIGMRFRRSPVRLLVDAHIALKHQGNPTSITVIEACYMAHKHQIHDLNSLMQLLPKYQEGVESKKPGGAN